MINSRENQKLHKKENVMVLLLQGHAEYSHNYVNTEHRSN